MREASQREKAAAFDLLMRVLQGKHEVVRRFEREAAHQPDPRTRLIETVSVCEWSVRYNVVGQPDLKKLLIDEARPAPRVRMAICAPCGFLFRWQRKRPGDDHSLQCCPNCLVVMPGTACITHLAEPSDLA
jgi:hypothetical protein